jgi:hypothetical protein
MVPDCDLTGGQAPECLPAFETLLSNLDRVYDG